MHTPLLDLLGQCAIPQSRALFVRALCDLAEKWQRADVAQAPDLFSDFIQWCTENRTAPALMDAIARYHSEREMNRRIHRYVVARLGLDRNHGRVLAASLPKHYVRRLDMPYPPSNYYVAESETIDGLWRHYFATQRQPDERKQRQAPHLLQPEKLVQTVGPGESCVLIDADDDSIVAVILRGASGTEDDSSSGFLDWATTTIKDGLKNRRHIRKEDPGLMIQMGYTAGQISVPCFNWVRNLVDPYALTPEQIASTDYANSCLFAAGWNIIRSSLPHAVTDDWVAFLCKHGLPVMDAGVGMEGLTGNYSIQFGDNTITFHDAELAPPTGMLNWNYAWAIHHEHQPHGHAIQWIISRSHGEAYGGHFYISAYGVRIINTSDTMIAWRPTDEHGTSLAQYSPNDPTPPFNQFGICYCTSQRLATVRRVYGNALRKALGDDVADVPFSKRKTAEDEAAAIAAEEFVQQLTAGVVFGH
ncbi:hypothetical protein BN946_scf185003.g5 [Trametes cinnabarina]|uniref:Uncharacterized protein n=1 Tax=Pycnoporus cinnabarinus TaxID=5643 RepID=A0A060S6W7_PYCCI|nr:hypothetical protein BN946_scf185003.g5 [Trametes cinnabarina]